MMKIMASKACIRRKRLGCTGELDIGHQTFASIDRIEKARGRGIGASPLPGVPGPLGRPEGLDERGEASR